VNTGTQETRNRKQSKSKKKKHVGKPEKERMTHATNLNPATFWLGIYN
jgi:hypothetical protein